MINVEVVAAKQRLDRVFELVRQLPEDFETRAHWARYLCVLVSGFLERSLRALYGAFATSCAAPSVVRFVEQELKQFQNPSMGKILELARSFDPAWGDALEATTAGKLKDAVDSIVANRHNIAHGQYTGITLARIIEYYGSAVTVLELIDDQCRGGE